MWEEGKKGGRGGLIKRDRMVTDRGESEEMQGKENGGGGEGKRLKSRAPLQGARGHCAKACW